MEKSPIYRHVILPALAPMAFLVIAATPVEVLGCFNRGLLAVLIAIPCLLVALGLMMNALVRRIRGQGETLWSVVTSLILSIPAVLLLIWA